MVFANDGKEDFLGGGAIEKRLGRRGIGLGCEVYKAKWGLKFQEWDRNVSVDEHC